MSSDIIGRDEELATLREFLDGVPEGPAVLVLEGEPGVGKTTLRRAGVEAAKERSLTVLEASPAEAEARMSFAAIDDLLGGVVADVLPTLPPPQRRALAIALLLTEAEGQAPDERTLAVAFLNALRTLSASVPVLVAIDDIQWLDTPSARVLGYAVRRLRDERVGLLLALRTDEASAPPAELAKALGGDNVSSLALDALTLGALHRLLQDRLGLVLARPALRRIHGTSGGNPFYALEMARALEPEVLRDLARRPLPVPPSLGELLEGRIAVLPPETQRALLVAASLSEPRTTAVTGALGMEAGPALLPAIEAHIVSVDGERVRFAHPLLAAATYARADDVDRRAVHRRLAAIVEDQEERARHLALAADGPDEVVAAALENAAAASLARGASAAAVELSEQALWLTPPERESEVRRRTIATALHRFRAGDATAAKSLLEDALPSMPSGADRARALVLLQRVHRYEGDQPRAAELAREVLTEPGADDRVRADAAQGLASTLFFLRENLEDALDLATTAVELSARAGTPGLHANATGLKGVLEALLGHPGALATLQTAEELDADALTDFVIDSGRFAKAYVMPWMDNADQAGFVMRACREEALTLGIDGAIPMLLANLASAEYLTGRWAQAEQLADEGYEAALQTGQRPQQGYSLAVRGLVRASLGKEPEARADADAALVLAGKRGMGVAKIHAVWALGMLALSLDRPDEAVRLIAPLREQLLAAGVREPGSIRFVSDEIEALVALSRVDEAGVVLSWLEERGRELDRASALGSAARCRGLLAAAVGDLESGINEFEQSLVQLARARIPFEQGRTLLALGSTQRRAKKKAAARKTLGSALSCFQELGAAIWAARARSELARIGGRAPSRDELTPTERRVAELVAEGRTNKEVAAALFVTDRTVEFHLSHVYRKLGVRSRSELARTFSR